MNSHNIFCQNIACSARGQIGKGNIRMLVWPSHAGCAVCANPRPVSWSRCNLHNNITLATTANNSAAQILADNQLSARYNGDMSTLFPDTHPEAEAVLIRLLRQAPS